MRSGSGEPSIEELRERVSSRFRSVGAAAGALRAELRAAADPRQIARRHPAWVLGSAAGAGVLAAVLFRRRRRDARAVGWLGRSPDGPPPRVLAMAVGAPLVRGAFGLVATMLVRRLVRTLGDEVRPRPRLVAARRGPA